MEIISVCVVTVVVVAILCCLIVMLSSNAKRGRQVEARVRSCEQKGRRKTGCTMNWKWIFTAQTAKFLSKPCGAGKSMCRVK